MDKRTVAVIGGGAAGMMSAIAAAQCGAKVTVFERNDRVGKKILATGNGKCNFSNLNQDTGNYCSQAPGRLAAYLDRFGAADAVSFFQSAGMMVKDKNGYLYPASEQASTVLDTLRLQMEGLQVHVVTGLKVNDVYRDQSGKIKVCTENGAFGFDRGIIACGSKAAPKTGSDGNGYDLARKLGHRVVAPVPALVQLRCMEDGLKSVAGVRAEAQVTLLIDGKEAGEERGELQLTDYGISGIVVFQLSRTVSYALLHNRQVKVKIDFFPGMGEEDYRLLAAGRRLALSDRTAEGFFTGMLNKKLMLLFMKQAGIKPDVPAENVPAEQLDKVFDKCRSWELTATGTNSFEQAQVCAGGVSLEEVDENLQSLKTPGIYFAGEILDVDGKCGGYNLQWAWTSGRITGESAAVL